MTPNKEDYLKIIYQEGGQTKKVSNKTIATGLGISPASVTEMLLKLSHEGLLTYEPYKGSMLTEKGLDSCLDVVRSHRLWEVFLIRHLGYSWSEAHEDAHILEHAAPPRMVARLDKFLNYPSYCPHGSAIPKHGEANLNANLLSLSNLKANQSGNVRMVSEEHDLLDYLEGLGVRIGSKIKVLSLGEYEGPIGIILDDREIQISYKASEKVFIELDD